MVKGLNKHILIFYDKLQLYFCLFNNFYSVIQSLTVQLLCCNDTSFHSQKPGKFFMSRKIKHCWNVSSETGEQHKQIEISPPARKTLPSSDLCDISTIIIQTYTKCQSICQNGGEVRQNRMFTSVQRCRQICPVNGQKNVPSAWLLTNAPSESLSRMLW